MEIKLFFALGAIALNLLGDVKYLISVLKYETKPHVFSWVNILLVDILTATAQFSLNAGYAAWVEFWAVVFSVIIVVIAFFRSNYDITKSDTISFGLTLTIIPLWLLTKSAFMAAAALCLINLFTYYPTFRKSWNRPSTENILSYVLWVSASILTALAVTFGEEDALLIPVSNIIIFGVFILYLHWRRSVNKTFNCSN